MVNHESDKTGLGKQPCSPLPLIRPALRKSLIGWNAVGKIESFLKSLGKASFGKETEGTAAREGDASRWRKDENDFVLTIMAWHGMACYVRVCGRLKCCCSRLCGLRLEMENEAILSRMRDLSIE